MNTFRIVELNHRMDETLNYDYINSGGHSIQIPKVELTLIPVSMNDDFLFKLANISSKNRTITINDNEYADYLEPFKKRIYRIYE